MANQDTVRLLRECNSGIKMGVNSIDQVLDKVSDEKLKQILINNKEEHQKLGSETHRLIEEAHDEDKEPNIMASSMSWLKTNVMLAMDKNDATISDLITDGCHMGIKSLNRYLNQYKDASDSAKDITKRLIKLEENLAEEIKCFL
ncbi:MAG: hypothetical protein IKW62_05700 [Clostridia bacterium]|nr:hypothetical protein [Clostridia bacterium]